MDINILKEFIKLGLSTYQISKRVGKSQTSIRYWMKKFNLKTNLSERSDNSKCLTCEKELTGLQRKFCCNICRCKYNNYYANGGNGYQTYENQKQRGNDRKNEFIEIKGGKCMVCGYNKCNRALTFHHREPEHKKIQLDARSLSNRTLSKCLEELEKCDLLCFNCHMELHDSE